MFVFVCVLCVLIVVVCAADDVRVIAGPGAAGTTAVHVQAHDESDWAVSDADHLNSHSPLPGASAADRFLPRNAGPAHSSSYSASINPDSAPLKPSSRALSAARAGSHFATPPAVSSALAHTPATHTPSSLRGLDPPLQQQLGQSLQPKHELDNA